MKVCIFSTSCFNKPIKKYNINFVSPPPTYLPKQKRNTKSSSNPFNAKISFEAYLHIPVSKVEEGNYESYNLQGVYLCLFVVAGIGVEECLLIFIF
jgi:hypothetical protein